MVISVNRGEGGGGEDGDAKDVARVEVRAPLA